MTKFTGKNMYITFKGTVLSARYRSMEESEEMGLVDQSAGADAARTYLTTLEDGSATLEFLAEEGGSAEWLAVVKGAEGDLLWAEEGTEIPNQYHTVNAIVKSRKKSYVYEDVVKISVELQFSGVVAEANYAA